MRDCSQQWRKIQTSLYSKNINFEETNNVVSILAIGKIDSVDGTKSRANMNVRNGRLSCCCLFGMVVSTRRLGQSQNSKSAATIARTFHGSQSYTANVKL